MQMKPSGGLGEYEATVPVSNFVEEEWIPIVLSPRPRSRSGYGQAVDLILPAGYSADMLRRLNYAGAKVIGLKEYRSICGEREEFSFPCDLASSEAYQTDSRIEAERRMEAYCRKPPSKRVNYRHIAIDSPFAPSWRRLTEKIIFPLKHRTIPLNISLGASVGGIVCCSLEMEGRGWVREGSAICVPSSNDIAKVFENLRRKREGEPSNGYATLHEEPP